MVRGSSTHVVRAVVCPLSQGKTISCSYIVNTSMMFPIFMQSIKEIQAVVIFAIRREIKMSEGI